MGIKVISTKQKSTAITKFPCIGILGEGQDSKELIVLFVNACTGTVLNSTSYDIGHTSNAWQIREFSIYEGTVTLSNN